MTRRASNRKAGTPFVVFVTMVTTVVATLLVLNFLGGEKRIVRPLEPRFAVADPQFAHEVSTLLGPPLVPGNRIETLDNGDRIFPAMLEAIRSAQKTVTFESYIYWSGAIGQAFADALSERARAGVRVHVLLDGVGSAKMDDALVAEMADAGVQVRKYHTLRCYDLARLNNRTHRKILVADGRVGFTGGVGIAPEWTGDAQDPDHWRDVHYRIEGPVVAQMQAVFMDNWIKTTGEVLQGIDYFPLLQPRGDLPAQMFSSSPDGGSESMALLYRLSVASATKTIDLSAAYFVPDSLTLDALVQAIRRGVRVRIVVPGPYIDSETTLSASRSMWGSVLAAGGTIAQYQPTMFHCKVMVVDGLFVSVGSTNFDNRSFRLNDEASLNVVDAGFAAEQTRHFEADLAKSKVVTFEAWSERGWKEKAGDFVASLLRSQL